MSCDGARMPSALSFECNQDEFRKLHVDFSDPSQESHCVWLFERQVSSSGSCLLLPLLPGCLLLNCLGHLRAMTRSMSIPPLCKHCETDAATNQKLLFAQTFVIHCFSQVADTRSPALRVSELIPVPNAQAPQRKAKTERENCLAQL